MSEDIHKWTDGRYTLMFDEHTFFVWDNENDERMTALNVTKKLNEQQSIIQQKDKQIEQLNLAIDDLLTLSCDEIKKQNEQLRQQLKEKEEDEQLYANEILELRKTNEEWLQFKDLGGDY